MAVHTEHDRSIGELLREFGDGTRELIRQEMRLARAEVRENVDHAKRGVMWFIAASVPALMALILIPIGLMFWLDGVMPTWAAALLLAGIFLVMSAVLAFVGKRTLDKVRVIPEETKETVQRNVQWMKEEAKQQLS